MVPLAGRELARYRKPLTEGGYPHGDTAMEKARYVYWQDEDMWLGYLEQFPDYMTQGESVEDLQAHLLDLYRDLTSGQVPGVRRVAELDVP